MKKRRVSLILAVCILAASALFVFLIRDRDYPVEEAQDAEREPEEWTLQESVVNGRPLVEDKCVYTGEEAGELTALYITVFPTRDEKGGELTFDDFKLHTARNKDYNPILNAGVVFGGPDGELPVQENLETVNATIRVRGNSSRGEYFKSYKIKFKDDTAAFHNQTTLNVNKHVSDVSKITNKFCMDLLATLKDMASFRTNFMAVYIRDASLPGEEQEYRYYGLYTHVEQPNKSYLRARGLDANGSLYKANNFEFRLSDVLKNIDDPQYDEEAFETVLNIREGKDHTKLLKMLEDVNDMNQDFDRVFTEYFNEDNYLTWMACNILLGNEDTIAHNFILYNPQDSLTWYFLPWDYDGTFKFGEYRSRFNLPTELKGIQRMSGVILHRRYFRQPGNVDKLTAKMDELMGEYFTKEKVDGLLDDYLSVVEPFLRAEPDLSLCEIPPDEYRAYLSGFYGQIAANYEDYKASLEYPMPVFISEPIRKADGSILFAWEPSYDFQSDLLSYRVRVARDPELRQVVFDQGELIDNTCLYEEGLPAGTYYLAVTITDDKGHSQYSLDSYEQPGEGMKYGVREFTVD